MSNTAPNNKIIFYDGINFAGNSYIYQVGDEENLPEELNDKFKSVRVGKNCRVIVSANYDNWKDYDSKNVAGVFEEDTVNLDHIGGISQVSVQEK